MFPDIIYILEARTPIGASGNFNLIHTLTLASDTKIPEWVVEGFQNFAWAPNSQKYEDFKQNKYSATHWWARGVFSNKLS
jgi:hypothetical protein